MQPLVSIITPCYNSSCFISESITSVINQTYSNWELLVVDDKSTDNTKEIILSFSSNDQRIRPLFLDNNVGPAQARNFGIERSKGRYIAFLDADDVWFSNKLKNQLLFMQNNDIAFSYTTYQRISEDGLIKYNTIKAPELMTYSSYLKNTIIGCLTVVIDRDKTGDFLMPNISSSHDMALWLLIMKRGFDAYGLDENLAGYRVTSSSNTSNKIKVIKDVWIVYRKLEQLNLFYSLFCFCSYFVHAVKKRMI
tara:strand:+ start:10178 stop:10930 length:753 start_codon:yes stop_codon:yes gene_type:complete